MPGRLRQGTGVSDKAQNCCNACCKAVCRLKPWNKVVCYAVLGLIAVSLLLIIGGAFAVASSDAQDICTLGGSVGSGEEPPKDPTVPISGQNAYVWWLKNAGIFSIIMVVMTLICCGSYVGLCCGFQFSVRLKILAILGFVLLALGFALFVGWLALGSYLISQFGPRAVFEKVCRGVLAYVLFMYAYVAVFVFATVAAVLFSCFGNKEDASKKGRESVQSKLPPGGIKMLTAMV